VNSFGSSAVTFGVKGLWVSIDRGNDGNGGFVGTFTPLGGPTVPVFAPVVNNNDDEFFMPAPSSISDSEIRSVYEAEAGLKPGLSLPRRPGCRAGIVDLAAVDGFRG
jgi:hypothetical protein